MEKNTYSCKFGFITVIFPETIEFSNNFCNSRFMATQNMSQTPLRSRSPGGAPMDQVLNPVSPQERSRMASCSSARGIFLFQKKNQLQIIF